MVSPPTTSLPEGSCVENFAIVFDQSKMRLGTLKSPRKSKFP